MRRRWSSARWTLPATQSALDLAVQWWHSFAEMDGLNRSMGLASRAFLSFLPLVIVVSAVAPFDPHNLQQTIERKMGVSGATTAAIQRLIAPKGEIRNQLTLIGLVLLLYSALSFMRALQQLYEHVW